MELAFLRLLHISFASFWAGAAVVMGFWVNPALAAAGPSSAAVAAGIVADRKFPQVMTGVGLVTLVTGFRLYMLRFSTGWLATPEGIALTLGGLLAIGGFAIGVMAQRPTAAKMAALQQQVAAAGQPPTTEQLAELQRLGARLVRLGKVLAVHLGTAAILMAAMRLAQVLST